MMVFGWTLEQLAYAHARLKESPSEDGNGILRLREEWMKRHLPPPLEVKFEGVSYDIPGESLVFAHNAMVNAMVGKSSRDR